MPKTEREEKVCRIGPGQTRCYLLGEGWAGKVWWPTTNTLSAYIRIEPPNGKRAFSRYVPGLHQMDVYLQSERPSWLSAP